MLIGKTEIYDNSVLIGTTDQQNSHKSTVASKLDLMKRSKKSHAILSAAQNQF